jgi:hypothetical protein
MQRFQFASIALAASGIGLALAVPAQAQLSSSFATQATLTVAPAIIEASAQGSSSSMSGSGLIDVTLPVIDATGGITAGLATAPDDLAFSFAQAVNAKDTVGAVTITTGQIGSLPTYSDFTATVGGVAGDLAATLTSAGVATITAGGVGTTASLLQQNSLTVFK